MPRNNNAKIDNPCLREQELSFKCLNKNNFDRDKCEIFFVNYNACKEFWNKIRLDRRRKGIEPYLPSINDREQIKAEYMKTKSTENS